ncbi:MAG: polysaccharide deacetylase family protein [bacterium]|nr:polysaccharide deacetylase family protein [bacterium]
MGSDTDRNSVSSRPSVLAFHKLTNHLTYGINNYSPRRFRQLFDFLQQRGLDLKDILVTFDDAYEHLYHQLPPLMEWYGIRPLLFVPTAFVGKENSWDFSYRLRAEKHLSETQITELADRGVRFGSHGDQHVDLSRLNEADCRSELSRSKQLLQELTGQEVNQISYPFGRYNQQVVRLAVETGYKAGYTTRYPREADSNLQQGRYPVYAFDTPPMVMSKINPGFGRELQSLGSKLIGFFARGTHHYQKLESSKRKKD